MELLKFIAGEFLHIEPKACLFAPQPWVFRSAAMHQRRSGLGWLQSWPVGVGTSIPSSVFPREALELPHEGGKDLTAGMENKPAFFIGKQSGTCTSRQDIDHDLASTASIMVHSLSCWTNHPKATVDVIFFKVGLLVLD